MDFLRESALRRQVGPSLAVPDRDRNAQTSAAVPANGRTDRCSRRPSLLLESRSAHENTPADRGHPLRLQNLDPTETAHHSQGQLQRGKSAADQALGLVPVEIFHALDWITEFREHAILHLSAT